MALFAGHPIIYLSWLVERGTKHTEEHKPHRKYLVSVKTLCFTLLQWNTVTCWVAVQRTSPWPRETSVWTQPSMSPCSRPNPSSRPCRCLQAWVVWPWLQRGYPCSTQTSSNRLDRHWYRSNTYITNTTSQITLSQPASLALFHCCPTMFSPCF